MNLTLTVHGANTLGLWFWPYRDVLITHHMSGVMVCIYIYIYIERERERERERMLLCSG